MWWWSQKSSNPVGREYQKSHKWFTKKTPLSELKIISIDAETSGFDQDQDRLLSIATVNVLENEILINTMRNWVVFQANADANEATKVHGILPSQTAQGEPESLVLSELLPELRGALIVGHHVGFDIGMIGSAVRRHFQFRFHTQFVDTGHIAMRHIDAFRQTGYANQQPPSLDEICIKLGVEMVDRHTAAGDAYTTAEVFLFFCAQMRQHLGRPLVLGDLPLVRV